MRTFISILANGLSNHSGGDVQFQLNSVARKQLWFWTAPVVDISQAFELRHAFSMSVTDRVAHSSGSRCLSNKPVTFAIASLDHQESSIEDDTVHGVRGQQCGS